MSNKIIVILLLITIPAITSFTGFENAAEIKILHNVPMINQQTEMWCWAACTDMVLTQMGDAVSQCQQANERLSRTDCCDQPTPVDCVRGGWPQFYRYGLTSDSVNTALSWNALKAQIDSRQPVVFSWRWNLGGGHIMVAVGYVEADINWVYVNDPWPTQGGSELPRGDHKIITYKEYVSSINHTHWRDYYNIVPRIESGLTGTGQHVEIEESGISISAPANAMALEGGSNITFDRSPEPIGGYKTLENAIIYPQEAREAELSGRAVLNFLVDKEGQVAEWEVLQTSGHAILDQAAINAVRKIKWKPAMHRTTVVDTWVAIPIVFIP